MFRPDREQRGEDPLLLVKITIFLVAAAVAFTGMALQRRWIIFTAIILLAVAFLLRFLRPRADDSAAEAEPASQPPKEDSGTPDDPRP
jgi:membrane protein implicated in regulation of membrane protease activity